MSHVTLAHQGIAAVEAKNWEEGIEKLTKALQNSLNPTWLIARSKALINTGRFRESLEDANLAWNSAYQRNKRQQMVEANYRRAVAYYRLGEFANADCCCLYAMRLSKGGPAVEKEDVSRQWTDEQGFWTQTLNDAMAESREEHQESKKKQDAMSMGADSSEKKKDWRLASTLRIQILRSMEKLQPDDPARKLTTTPKPEEKKLSNLGSDAKVKEEQQKPAAASASSTATAAKPVVPADTPLRLQDFQSNTNMSVSIFSKGINKDKFQVEFLPFSARLDPVVYPNGDEKEFVLDLWGEIEPSESKYTVTPNKVELSLKKKTPGKWAQLQGDAKTSEADSAEKNDEAVELLKQARKKAMQAADAKASIEAEASTKEPEKPSGQTAEKAPAAAGPAYPTSSRSGPKNWDSIGADEDDDDGRDVNFFFKNLYKNASPEQQRAMMKSFTESNGTSLSTDWNDVKGRTVETSPPDGVEAKKW
ncbi:hypothetical protein HJFPF1_11534 [Paramyrothecium foliicola]|nr:hypothetical protein HJFPF1_11534 [Paramyrothecium foliicola]